VVVGAARGGKRARRVRPGPAGALRCSCCLRCRQSSSPPLIWTYQAGELERALWAALERALERAKTQVGGDASAPWVAFSAEELRALTRAAWAEPGVPDDAIHATIGTHAAEDEGLTRETEVLLSDPGLHHAGP
jgi:hypothetical protein